MEAWKCKRCENKYLIKLEGEFAFDPTWCGKCDLNIDIIILPISPTLKEALLAWGSDYLKWIDFESDSLVINGIELQDEFNKKGLVLAEKVKNEFGKEFSVTFKPSCSAEEYNALSDI